MGGRRWEVGGRRWGGGGRRQEVGGRRWEVGGRRWEVGRRELRGAAGVIYMYMYMYMYMYIRSAAGVIYIIREALTLSSYAALQVPKPRVSPRLHILRMALCLCSKTLSCFACSAAASSRLILSSSSARPEAAASRATLSSARTCVAG